LNKGRALKALGQPYNALICFEEAKQLGLFLEANQEIEEVKKQIDSSECESKSVAVKVALSPLRGNSNSQFVAAVGHAEGSTLSEWRQSVSQRVLRGCKSVVRTLSGFFLPQLL
jgi:hypothetical protein